MLLYVHVPFCRTKCRYCAFHSTPLTAEPAKSEEVKRYFQLLKREIALSGRLFGRASAPAAAPAAPRLTIGDAFLARDVLALPEADAPAAPGRLDTLYFGGGTPSLLPLAYLERLVAELRRHFDWDAGAEFTVEANPDSADRADFFKRLLALGVNRLSLGAQSFDDETLRLLGRPHTASQTLTAFMTARQAGFRNISLDLIHGLPGQRLRLWLEQVKQAVRLKPEHLSCYGLTIEPGTPFQASLQTGDLSLPDEEEEAKMFLYGADYLESEGYLQYEISSFAKMGFVSRHNSGYWSGRDYLGLGPGAVSTVAGRRWENPKSLDEYERLLKAMANGAERPVQVLDDQTRLREYVMLGLRASRGVSLKGYRERTGRNLLKEKRRLIEGLVEHGLARFGRGYLRLTRRGMLVSNSVIAALLPEREDT